MLNSRDISLLRSDVAANCRKFVELCKAAGYPVLVTNTVRDAEYQEYLYAQGRTRPGSIVTNGKRPTFHWDKAGLAFDICKNVKGHEYDDPAFWSGVSAIGKKMGFTWGGDWKSFVDKPHFQWDNHGKYTNSMILAGNMPPTMPLYNGSAATVTGGEKTVTITLPIIQIGSKGASVTAMQQLLTVKGYDTKGADGIFGANTDAALRKYQKGNGLTVDGICGKASWTALLTK